tara:strand:+ start:3285 stop:3392 length:108 start_codon:yes stop_codon:yes gene_type:complete
MRFCIFKLCTGLESFANKLLQFPICLQFFEPFFGE